MDIKLLINYIQDKGYQARIGSNRLIIWKIASGLRYYTILVTPLVGLKPESWDILRAAADQRIQEIEQTITADAAQPIWRPCGLEAMTVS